MAVGVHRHGENDVGVLALGERRRGVHRVDVLEDNRGLHFRRGRWLCGGHCRESRRPADREYGRPPGGDTLSRFPESVAMAHEKSGTPGGPSAHFIPCASELVTQLSCKDRSLILHTLATATSL